MKLLSIVFILVFGLALVDRADGQAADTVSPEIGYFSFVPFSVNTANGFPNITVTVRALDTDSGVNNVQVRFRSPSGNQTVDVDLNSSFRTAGDNKDGVYRRTVTFSGQSEPGVWLVDYVYTLDEAGNSRFIYTSELISRGYLTRLQVFVSNCIFSFVSPSQDFPASGGSGIVTGTTQTGCTVGVISNDFFINANSVSASGSFGSPTLSFTVPFTVAANEGAARTGTITVSGQTFTINQAAGKSRKRVRFF